MNRTCKGSGIPFRQQFQVVCDIGNQRDFRRISPGPVLPHQFPAEINIGLTGRDYVSMGIRQATRVIELRMFQHLAHQLGNIAGVVHCRFHFMPDQLRCGSRIGGQPSLNLHFGKIFRKGSRVIGQKSAGFIYIFPNRIHACQGNGACNNKGRQSHCQQQQEYPVTQAHVLLF